MLPIDQLTRLSLSYLEQIHLEWRAGGSPMPNKRCQKAQSTQKKSSRPVVAKRFSYAPLEEMVIDGVGKVNPAVM